MYRTLESVLTIDGIQPQIVFVAFDEKFVEFEELIRLFNFKAISIPSSFSYAKLIEKTFKKIFDDTYIKVNSFNLR